MTKGDIFFSLSVRSVRLNFTRSILAAIGIVIGVVAIASMGMLGTNMQLEVKDQLASSANTIVISSDSVRMGPPGTTPSSSASTTISKTQLNKIKTVVGTDGTVIPIYSTSSQFTLSSVPGRAQIYGIDPEYITQFLTLNETYESTNIEGVNDALVGANIAEQFDLRIGSRIKIGSSDSTSRPEVRIVGILEERGTTADGVSADNAIIVNDKWYTNEYGSKDKYSQVNVIVNDIDSISTLEEQLDAKLNTDEKTPAVRIRDATSQLETATSTLSTVTTFIMAIGGISLLVAAVSIFNVMMMSVNERIQEIGILLSIGTERGEVRRMFLYEAFILGLLGAVIGGICSLAIGYSVVDAMIGTTEFFFQFDSIIYVPAAMAIGVVVCVLSGLYPAWRASNMDPIDALRSE